MKMFSVPSVTMNGGSFTRVTRTPLSGAGSVPTPKPRSRASEPGHPVVGGDLGHHHRAKDHDGADRQVDAGGQDDDGLADGERADHGDLLEDQREVLSA